MRTRRDGILRTSLLAAVVLLVGACAGAELPMVGSDRPRIDAVFAEYDDPASPGCALGIVVDGEWRYRRGYGMANLEHGVAIHSGSIFRVGSVSKQFTAMAVLLLDEEGILSLDDDIRKYLPEMPDFGPTVTVRQLIHHTSGLRDYLTLMELAGYRPEDYYDDPELLRLLSRQQDLNFAPGTDFAYSNTGYFLLGQIVRRATGQGLRQVASERIFRPLGMERTHFHDDWREIVEGRATGYAPAPDGGFEIAVTTLPMIGDGGVFTSVDELLAWDRNFYDNRLGAGGPALIERWLEPGRLADGTVLDYSAGIVDDAYRGLRLVSHGGAFVGYRADILRFPEQRTTVMVLCNVASADPSTLGRRVADVLLGDVMAESPPTVPTTEDAEDAATTGDELLPVAELRHYAGRYRSPELDAEYLLYVDEGHLLARVRARAPMRLRPLEEDGFALPDGNVTLHFRRDAAGNVLGFVLDAGRVRNLAFLRVE